MNEINSNELKESLLEYGNSAGQAAVKVPAAFSGLRKNALEKFSDLGFPTVKNEEWRFTNVLQAMKYRYVPSIFDGAGEVVLPDVSRFIIPDLKANLLVFINGVFSERLSSIIDKKNIVIGSVNQIGEAAGHVEDLNITNGFSALNQAMFSDGAYIMIPDNSVPEHPVHLLFISGHEYTPLLVQPRNVIIAGKNSQSVVIESYHSMYSTPYLFNAISSIRMDDYAIMDYYKIQNEQDNIIHINRTDVTEGQSSVFNSSVFTFGGQMIRNDLDTRFTARYAEAHYYGLYLTEGSRHIDNHTLIDHAVPECHSNELYKGIMDDDSRAVFNGKVIVRKDAQKTLAYQSNKNLLLSKGARVNTKPQLEIFADDVKCSHGATVGRLDDEALFYLVSRGIGRNTARSILINAFAGDIVDRIKLEPLRGKLSSEILERLHNLKFSN
ncbi:MAG: Fe-S cluster assembly protein SufD [Bacteroidota bacterium]